MVPIDANVKCPWCEKVETLKKWEDTSYAECFTRELRRGFRSLTTESVWKKTSKNFYKCPNCGQWSRGNKLKIVNTSDPKLRELGGQPLIESED